MKRFILSLVVWSMVFSFVLFNVVLADSTIGVNISTTGTLSTTSTLTTTATSATAVRFQNASGTNLFIVDTTNFRVGVNKTPSTKFEVGGTASATNFMSNGAVQFAGNSSVAYSRFGTTTTNHANYISASNDLLVSGDVEIRGSVSFGSTASVSGIFYMNDGRFRPNANSATAFRFQNTAGTTNVLTIDTTNTRVGVNAGGDVDTTLEVGGTASISDQATFGEDVSVSGRFELTSSAARFGLNAGGFTDTALEVGGTASASGNVYFGSKASISSNLQISGRFIADTAASHSFTGDLVVKGSASGVASISHHLNVGENSTATTSVTFETRSTTQGVCFVITNTAGTVWYARLVASGSGGTQAKWYINATDCR